jgi:hypothetical protein
MDSSQSRKEQVSREAGSGRNEHQFEKTDGVLRTERALTATNVILSSDWDLDP